jgi:hypothetical protein
MLSKERSEPIHKLAAQGALEATEKQMKENIDSISQNPLLKRIFTHVAQTSTAI